jgi:hypothetical protein
MNLLDYTSFGEIRATLGVNDVELTNDTLSLEMYASNLMVELDDIGLSLRDTFTTVAAVDPRSAAEERLYRTTRMFAMYAVAKHCGVALPMFGPKTVVDNKAEVSRFAQDPYKETLRNIGKEYEVYRQRATAALGVVLSSSPNREMPTFMAVSSPTVDEVIGS